MTKKFKNETALQNACKEYAEEKGLLAYKFESPGNAGVPDYLYILPWGKIFFVEFKHPNGEGVLSPLQEDTIKIMSDQFVTVFICSEFEDFKWIIYDYFTIKRGRND